MAKVISKSTLLVALLAIMAGLVAAYGARYFSRIPVIPRPQPAPPRQLTVPVASENLPADRVIMPGDIVNLPIPETEFAKRFKGVNTEKVIANVSKLVNRRLLKPIKQGQPFLTSDLYLEGTGPSITSKLQPGFRAVRVDVPDTRESGVHAGTFVDVVFRATPTPAKNGQPAIPETTVTLLRHIEVIDTERPRVRRSTSATKRNVLVTLAVPENKTQIFSTIEGRGDVWLVPASADEKGVAGGETGAAVATSGPMTLAGLLGIKPPPPKTVEKIVVVEKEAPLPPPPPPPPFETAVYRRGRLEVNKFLDGKLLTGRELMQQPPKTPKKKSSKPKSSHPSKASPTSSPLDTNTGAA